MAFVQRVIRVTISLGVNNQFVTASANNVVLEGYRVHASVTSYGLDSQGALQARIYGIPLSLINQLTISGPVNSQYRWQNSIIIEAGNYDGVSVPTYSRVFVGSIDQAWADFANQPDCSLTVIAYSSIFANIVPVSPQSYSGPTSIDTVLQAIVNSINAAAPGANMTFVNPNNAVVANLNKPYLPGSGLDQIRSVCKAAKCNYKIENNVLTIWPIGSNIQDGSVIPVISPTTGLVGYPAFNQNGIVLKSVFNPNLMLGHQVQVQGSSVKAANQTWLIESAVHTLESITPGGAWFTNVTGYPVS